MPFKFSQAFVTPNQKALTVVKIMVDEWFYIFGIPAQIHSDKGHSFKNSILEHFYSMYGVRQSTTTPYHPHGNSTCERFNCRLNDLLNTLDKEQKANWPLHLSSLVFAYNAMPHSVTGYQPYELMFSHKEPTTCDAWLGLAQYNDQYSQSKSTWVNEQHELIFAVNRQALKNIKQTASKTVLHAGGSPIEIPKDNCFAKGSS